MANYIHSDDYLKFFVLFHILITAASSPIPREDYHGYLFLFLHLEDNW